MFAPDPRAYLPHRPPFLFVGRLLDIQPGRSARGELAGIDEGSPPILLLEAMAQLGGIAAGQGEGYGGVLAALDRVLLPAAVPARARLECASRVVKRFGELVLVASEVLLEGTALASAAITLSRTDRI